MPVEADYCSVPGGPVIQVSIDGTIRDDEIIIWDDEFVQWPLRDDGSVDFEDYIYVVWGYGDLESTHTAEEVEAIQSRYHFDGSVEVKEAAFAAAEALVAAALRGENVVGVVLGDPRTRGH